MLGIFVSCLMIVGGVLHANATEKPDPKPLAMHPDTPPPEMLN